MADELDWDSIRKHAISSSSGPPEWPAKVKPISMDGAALLGLDDQQRLYWDGRLVEMERTLELRWWQTALATLTAFGTAAIAVVAILQYLRVGPPL